MIKLNQILVISTLSTLAACSAINDRERDLVNERLTILKTACGSCEVVARDLIDMVVEKCDANYLAAYDNITQENPIFLTVLGLNNMNPKGYNAYRVGALETIDCDDGNSWANKMSAYLSTNDFTNLYFEELKKANSTSNANEQ
ncbi:hypothetical protein OH460_08245 [Vibrio sp. Makdt]|uniref:hypothetical protein n=1 Tax=Vibrio sp. Makdt TaxID=2998828 RepID=UPI0022CDB71F|nr:hypothetical protein [Vibrio sp. Makdt]MDA0152289.1 hypothetical protein [Vibrio sp. Makdt]